MVSRKPLNKLMPDQLHCSMYVTQEIFYFGDTDGNTVTLGYYLPMSLNLLFSFLILIFTLWLCLILPSSWNSYKFVAL